MELALLKGVALFQELDEAELTQVGALCHERSYRRGEWIFRENDPGTELFLMVSGTVRLSQTIPGSADETLSMAERGACFGEVAVLDQMNRSADAKAMTDVRCLVIVRDELSVLLDRERVLAYKLLWASVRLLSSRLRTITATARSAIAVIAY
jgi:CRP/FNR family cyclic AMP-dependent transcriptional regulator